MRKPDPITNLINQLTRLPGIGEKTASRLAFFVINQPESMADELASALLEIKEKVRFCQRCCNLTEAPLCAFCADTRRDHRQICVVENVPDLRAIDQTGVYQGSFHVLHGLLDPLEGIGPSEIRVSELLQRLGHEETGALEVILAMSPSVDGEATALYLTRLIRPLEVRLTRIASGVPIGAHLEYTDRVTLSRALSERRLL
jgi:recombination protein RecR